MCMRVGVGVMFRNALVILRFRPFCIEMLKSNIDLRENINNKMIIHENFINTEMVDSKVKLVALQALSILNKVTSIKLFSLKNLILKDVDGVSTEFGIVLKNRVKSLLVGVCRVSATSPFFH
jgi:hypothetical protein